MLHPRLGLAEQGHLLVAAVHAVRHVRLETEKNKGSNGGEMREERGQDA